MEMAVVLLLAVAVRIAVEAGVMHIADWVRLLSGYHNWHRTLHGQLLQVEVKVGQKVLYGKYSGTEVSVEGEDYLIMRESDIFAILG